MSEDEPVTISPGSPYDESGPAEPVRQRRGLPARFVFLGALVVIVLIFTSSSSVQSWWAHRLHDVTGGNRTADYFIGLAVALLPVLGVVAGAVRARGPRRLFRMFLFGALGFIVTYLLAPSPARYLAHHSSRVVFDQQAPGYLAGVLTGTIGWLVLLALAVLRARARWRRFKARHTAAGSPADRESAPRVIDI
jgi:hypothetical protein